MNLGTTGTSRRNNGETGFPVVSTTNQTSLENHSHKHQLSLPLYLGRLASLSVQNIVGFLLANIYAETMTLGTTGTSRRCKRTQTGFPAVSTN
eukprot:scaffold695_cov113-Cylindrotheca_fusiformis.AAC.8